jgi:TRAP-type mannitol/chloroaromatic compound transport system substrate-binding protein
MYYGDGLSLWREAYDQFGVVPFYAGSSGVQAGGWFRNEINTLADLKGLKFRIAGLGGDVMRRLGVTTVLIPPGEIAPALLSGAIDAAEWIGPWNDRAFGLYKVAKYYYVPAFHEPGPGLEIIVNKSRWNELPPDLQAIVEAAASASANETYADFVYHNVEAFGPLVAESQVEVRTFADEIVEALGKATLEVFADLAATDPLTARVHDSFISFLRKADAYAMQFDARLLVMRHAVLTA